jgi:DNA helicase-2/ATP-dependent DNA helicase PcrA
MAPADFQQGPGPALAARASTNPPAVDLASLNDPQRQAVTHRSGPLPILAGAGSGKTRVLTMRIANLIDHGVEPERILALTFTNKAAREMRTRPRELLGRSPDGLWVGTFHAIAPRMLRPHADRLGYRAGFTIFDQDDSRSILKRALAELDVDPKKQPIAALQAAISKAKAGARSPQEISGRKASDRVLRAVCERSQALSRDSNGMDFDDLLLNLVQAEEPHPFQFATAVCVPAVTSRPLPRPRHRSPPEGLPAGCE